jgi:uncharacterized membrane protein YeaQ/YmgE (transglycosylase-associated protein family)
MSRESKILLWCLVAGIGFICLAIGEWLFEGFFDGGSDEESAKMVVGILGAMLLVAGAVLREVYESRKKVD